jgi:hypothetical protein
VNRRGVYIAFGPEPVRSDEFRVTVVQDKHEDLNLDIRIWDLLMVAPLYEYKVVELREKLMGSKMSGKQLEKLLNEHGQQGWQLRSITAVEVKGRLGPGSVEGVLVTFERSVSSARQY